MALGPLETIVLAIIIILLLSFFLRLLRMRGSPAGVTSTEPRQAAPGTTSTSGSPIQLESPSTVESAVGTLLPARNGALLRWCLQNGLRINQQMTLMTIGMYNEPKGAYLPSILF